MKQMTEIAIEVAELRAENKLLKSFNDSLIQALHKPVVVRPASASGSGGEPLPAAGSAKSVCGEKPAHTWTQLANDDIICTECGMQLRA